MKENKKVRNSFILDVFCSAKIVKTDFPLAFFLLLYILEKKWLPNSKIAPNDSFLFDDTVRE
jgi:hypothetical protein